MYYKSHKWVDTPVTKYERFRELRVRESRHTVMIFDRKYQNIDTDKFDTDKMHTLNSLDITQIGEKSTKNQSYLKQDKEDIDPPFKEWDPRWKALLGYK